RLLESLSGSPDAKTWTMKIHKGIKFTDGTTFDAAAIKANFDYHAASATSQGAGFAKGVASWDVSDPLVAKLTLTNADSVFPIDLVTRMVIMASPTALQKYGADYGTSPDKIVGAGPFTLTSWIRGSQLVFTRNPNYWDAPRPYLDTVT